MSSARSAFLVLALASGIAGQSPAHADPLPMPTLDFALKAKLRDGGTLDLAHSNGKMRMEMQPKASPAMVVGLIDLKAGKIVVMVPSMPKMAVQTDLPPEYHFAALTGSGTPMGRSTVAGEPCEIWKVETSVASASAGPTTACITPDGISLRTEVEIQGKQQLIYEATSVTRGPQDPHLFVMPTGVQTIKIPKGASAAALPSLIPGGMVR